MDPGVVGADEVRGEHLAREVGARPDPHGTGAHEGGSRGDRAVGQGPLGHRPLSHGVIVSNVVARGQNVVSDTTSR